MDASKETRDKERSITFEQAPSAMLADNASCHNQERLDRDDAQQSPISSILR